MADKINISVKTNNTISTSVNTVNNISITPISITNSDNNANIAINNTIVEVEISDKYTPYADSYTVESSAADQILNTKNKILKDDLTITKVPVWETSNNDGVTFYIGRNI